MVERYTVKDLENYMSTEISNRLKLSLGLEDNSQVEVNFNIDTDDDNNPDVDGSDEVVVDDGKSDEDLPDGESSLDEDEDEDEAEQLEEAKDSLESLKQIVSRHADAGTLTNKAFGMYSTALEAIVPSRILEEIQSVALEHRAHTSCHHAWLIAQVELEEVSEAIDKTIKQLRR